MNDYLISLLFCLVPANIIAITAISAALITMLYVKFRVMPVYYDRRPFSSYRVIVFSDTQ